MTMNFIFFNSWGNSTIDPVISNETPKGVIREQGE